MSQEKQAAHRLKPPQPLRDESDYLLDYVIKKSHEEHLSKSFQSLNLRVSKLRKRELLQEVRKQNLHLFFLKKLCRQPQIQVLPPESKGVCRTEGDEDQFLELTPPNYFRKLQTTSVLPARKEPEFYANLKKRFLNVHERSHSELRSLTENTLPTSKGTSKGVNHDEMVTSIKMKRSNYIRMSVSRKEHLVSIPMKKELVLQTFQSIARTKNQVRLVDRTVLRNYLEKYLLDGNSVQRMLSYLQIPQKMNVYNYVFLIESFSSWTLLDIQFFCFYVLKRPGDTVIDQQVLFQMLQFSQCFCDDAQLMFKRAKCMQYVAPRDHDIYSLILKDRDLTYARYRTLSRAEEEKDRQTSLEFSAIKTKYLYSSIKELPQLDLTEYSPLKRHEDGLFISFQMFRLIYQKQLPCIFGWLVYLLARTEVPHHGTKLSNALRHLNRSV